MRTQRVVAVLALMVLVVLAAGADARAEAARMTTNAVIESALGRGVIGREQAVLLKAYAVYAPWKLPQEYAGGVVDKCGVPSIREIEEALPTLSPEVAAEINSLRARPSTTDYIDTDHCRIHYNTTGTHKILNWPDTTYRDAVAAAAENCWATEVTALGFRQPPSDGPFPGNGGDGRYDFYVQALSGIYGYTQPEYYDGTTPQNDATSFIVIDNDYTGFGYPDPQDPMKVTVAHEFNHACQFAHDVDESLWYMEASATWMEDIVYDSINDYRLYLPYFLNYPYYALDANDGTGLRIYGACIWNHYISENHSNDAVVDIWYECESSTSTFSSLERALLTYGTDLAATVEGFSIWNFFTGSRNDGNHYSEGGSWPLAPMQATYNTYPIANGVPNASFKPDHLGCNYIRFTYPGSGQDGLLVNYDGPSTGVTPNSAYLNYVRSGSTTGYEYGEIPLNAWGVGEVIVYDWDEKSYVCLVAANLSTTANDMTYNYDVDEVDTGVEDDAYTLALKAASPNPFAGSTAIAYTVPSGGGLVEIAVYDVTGREVRKLVSDVMAAGDGAVLWDGLDGRGRAVASGVYFARIDVDGLTASGKLLMLK